MPFLFRSDSLTTTHLEFTVQTVTPRKLDEYSGAALRGNFFDAVWKRFCTNKSVPTCAGLSTTRYLPGQHPGWQRNL